jgi:hypothetical protein
MEERAEQQSKGNCKRVGLRHNHVLKPLIEWICVVSECNLCVCLSVSELVCLSLQMTVCPRSAKLSFSAVANCNAVPYH